MSADPWIEWDEGECPVDGHVRVDVQLYSGYEMLDVQASELNWATKNNPIVKYRVAS